MKWLSTTLINLVRDIDVSLYEDAEVEACSIKAKASGFYAESHYFNPSKEVEAEQLWIRMTEFGKWIDSKMHAVLPPQHLLIPRLLVSAGMFEWVRRCHSTQDLQKGKGKARIAVEGLAAVSKKIRDQSGSANSQAVLQEKGRARAQLATQSLADKLSKQQFLKAHVDPIAPVRPYNPSVQGRAEHMMFTGSVG